MAIKLTSMCARSWSIRASFMWVMGIFCGLLLTCNQECGLSYGHALGWGRHFSVGFESKLIINNTIKKCIDPNGKPYPLHPCGPIPYGHCCKQSHEQNCIDHPHRWSFMTCPKGVNCKYHAKGTGIQLVIVKLWKRTFLKWNLKMNKYLFNFGFLGKGTHHQPKMYK